MDHDHSHMTHTAECDQKGCSYIAQTHAHDDETAVKILAQDLADHNQSEHGLNTEASEIEEAVRAKMKRTS